MEGQQSTRLAELSRLLDQFMSMLMNTRLGQTRRLVGRHCQTRLFVEFTLRKMRTMMREGLHGGYGNTDPIMFLMVHRNNGIQGFTRCFIWRNAMGSAALPAFADMSESFASTLLKRRESCEKNFNRVRKSSFLTSRSSRMSILASS